MPSSAQDAPTASTTATASSSYKRRANFAAAVARATRQAAATPSGGGGSPGDATTGDASPIQSSETTRSVSPSPSNTPSTPSHSETTPLLQPQPPPPPPPPSTSSSSHYLSIPKRPSPLSHQITTTTFASSTSSLQTLSTTPANYGTLTPTAAPSSSTTTLPSANRNSRRPSGVRHGESGSSSSSPGDANPSKTGQLRSRLLFVLITLLLVICVYASFVDDFMGDVEAAISCGACIGLLVPLQALAHVGDDAFVDFFVGFCTKLGIEDEDVCAGAIGTQAPILAHDLRSISLASHAAKNFCSTVFGLCPLQRTIPYSVQFLDGTQGNDTRGLMDRPTRVWKSKGRKPLKVIHLSDVHVDRKYLVSVQWYTWRWSGLMADHWIDRSNFRRSQEGASTVCSKVICCRDYGQGSLGPDVSHPAGRFGNRHASPTRIPLATTSFANLILTQCDAPPDLVDSMFRAIDRSAVPTRFSAIASELTCVLPLLPISFVPDRAFTIFTGDVVESAVWTVNEPKVTSDLEAWHKDMIKNPASPSYPVIGNHDVAPVNAFPRTTSWNRENSTTTLAIARTSSDWVFELAARDWEKWIGPKASRQVRDYYGCYSRVHPGTDLRIISLNTNYWYKQNFWLYDHDEPLWDPNGILTWLSHELHAAEKAGQRAWIIGHMPFGKVDALRDQSNYAGQIFDRYHDTIAAHFYGHSHVDEFEISYPDYDDRRAETAHGIAYISGALTPASGNPVFRVYSVDPDTYEVLDFIPYYTNKSEPSFQIDPVWKPYYSARESYGTILGENGFGDSRPTVGESLNGKFWHRVTEVFEKNETAFQIFTDRLSRGGKVEDCSGSICKNNTICMLRSMRSESNCAVIQPGLSFKDQKRDTEAVTEPQRGEGEEEFAQSRQHDFFACEGPGLGSMLRKLAQGGFDTRKQNRKNRAQMIGMQRLGGGKEDKGHLRTFEEMLKERVKVEKRKKGRKEEKRSSSLMRFEKSD
ncbi:BQ2448_354 [Microbotryum intermedium]|uniref:BQ2448_354 protein n=1 Tax=Microbotryum intermedium TaxID=269621 RepID=A0A238F883_9BASI|nr:BQ2448_354 [Microbotryum intermedium]